MSKYNPRSTNINKTQLHLLRESKKNNNILIIQTDKNCGLALIDRDYYINRILKEHLCDGRTYQQLSPTNAQYLLSKFESSLLKLISKNKSLFSPIVKKYFTQGIKEATRIPVFYGTAKVHKLKISHIRFRLVNSQCDSLSALVSTYIDVKLQPFTTSMPAYIKNSQDLIHSLLTLPTLPSSARLFTSDATSMYTNINPDEGLRTIEKYITTYQSE